MPARSVMLKAAVDNAAIYPDVCLPPFPSSAHDLARAVGWTEGLFSCEIWARGKRLSLEYEEGDILLKLKHVWYA